MVNINDKKFIWSIFGGFLALSGMLIKNGYDNLKLKAPFGFGGYTYKLGPMLSALGMLITAMSIATTSGSASVFNLHDNGHGVLVMFAVGLVLWSNTQMEKYQSCDSSPDSKCPQHLIAGLSGGWALLALALAVQSKFAWLNTLLAFGAALLMIAAKLGVLPYQRRIDQVDGPGYAMITGSWFMLALANSL